MFRPSIVTRLPVAAVVLSLCPPVLSAQTAGNPAEVIVTATRRDETVDAVLATALVITRDDLDRSVATDIGDVLRMHAGIDVVRSGGPGQPTSVFIRGAESNHTLVLVDGIRVNPGTVGNAALQNFPPELVERIEVVKGPRSTLYGTDAIGGVIHIITRRPTTPGMHFTAQTGAGSHATRQGHALATVSGDRGSAGATVSWLQSDGFPTLRSDTVDRGFDNRSVGLHARTELGRVETTVRYVTADGTSQYSDFFRTPVDQDFTNHVATLQLAGAATERWRTQAVLGRFEDSLLQNQSDDRLRTERYSLDWQNDIAVGDAQRVTAGIVHSRESAEALSFGTGFDVDTDITTAYVQDEITTGRHRLLAAAGITDHSAFGSHVTWSAEYGIDVLPRTRLTAATGTAFRAPDTTDRFGFGGNTALEPETSRQFEVGVQHRFADRHSLRFGAFHNDIEQLIEYVVTDFVTFDGELRNVDRARIRGLELAWSFAGSTWQVHAEASHQVPEDRSTGKRLLRRAQDSIAIGYQHAFGPVELGVDVLGVDERADFGGVTLDAYALANVSLRYRISADWSVLARIENVLDEEYELASGYNTPDRGFFAAVRFAPK